MIYKCNTCTRTLKNTGGHYIDCLVSGRIRKRQECTDYLKIKRVQRISFLDSIEKGLTV